MFKLSKLKLNTIKGECTYIIKDFAYIYGKHDKGKTVFLDIIDYMMGDSKFSISNKQATIGINSIELVLESENRQLCLCRDEKNFYYKQSLDDEKYIRVVGIDAYKDKILDFILNGNYEIVDDYKKLTEKNIGYRSLSLFNYLPESGVADITNVFPKSKEIGELINIRSIILYIFNKENVLKITKLKEENERLEKELLIIREKTDGSLYCEKTIRENMAKLSLDNSNAIGELKREFEKYQKSLLINDKTLKNKDLIYLIKASQKLSEEIKYQLFLEEQSKHEIKNVTKTNRLLEMLTGILTEDRDNSFIVESLKSDIIKNKNDITLLNKKDYKKSISNLKEKKLEIDRQIEQINNGLDKLSYNEKIKIINVLDNAFLNYKSNNYNEQIEDIEKQIKENNKIINSLSNSFNDKSISQFNTLVTNIYKKFNSLEFVKADLSINGFELNFNPSKISVSATAIKKDKEGNDIEVNYMPGSKARMTLWQLVTYLAMSKFIKQNFNGMPFAEYIAIDAVIQEFSDEKQPTKEMINVIKEFVKDNEIQVIISGAINPQELDIKDNTVDISMGLNPAFKRIDIKD